MGVFSAPLTHGQLVVSTTFWLLQTKPAGMACTQETDEKEDGRRYQGRSGKPLASLTSPLGPFLALPLTLGLSS